MKNFESGSKIRDRAERCLREMREAFSEGDWNLTIRRAQEAVDLYLKSLLKCMNIEFPKVHNIAPLLIKEFPKIGISILPEEKDKLLFISSDLSRRRAPALYQEEEYSQEEAEEAKSAAIWVKGFSDLCWEKLI